MPRSIDRLMFALLLVIPAVIAAQNAPTQSAAAQSTSAQSAAAQSTPATGLSGEQQVRYYALLEELRCLVCQNQTLAESNAELAGDLRNRVLTMVKDGVSDDEILSFMTERYGDFIRYRPPLKPKTYLLWAMPLILLVLLLTALLRFVAVQSRKGPE